MYRESTSEVGFEDAFRQVLEENQPTSSSPWTYTIDKASVSVGGFVNSTNYTVRVHITGIGAEE